MNRKHNGQRHAVGIAGSSDDGHKRVTTIDEDQTVVGGSSENHERLVEVQLKLREKLKKEGHTLQTAGLDRIKDHVQEIVESS